MTCGKITFSNKAEARGYIHDKARGSTNFNGRPYECVKCGEWHFTTMSKAQSRRETRAYNLRRKERAA